MGFLRRPQNLKKSSSYFWQERRVLCAQQCTCQKVDEDFSKQMWSSCIIQTLIVVIICKKYFLGVCTLSPLSSCCKKWLFSLTKIVLLLSPALPLCPFLYPVTALNGQTTLQAKKLGRKSVNQKENTDWPMHKRNTGCLTLKWYKLNDS